MHRRNGNWSWRDALWALPVVALVVAQVRPVLSRLDRAVLATLEGTDALMQTGILTWTARHAWQPSGWADLPIFHPARSALVFMDSLLGQALLVAPLELVGDPAPPLLYNLAVVASLLMTAAAGAALWLAARGDRDSGSPAAGATLCALFLLGSPFTTWQLGMLNQISPPWPVFMLAAVLVGWRRFVAGGTGRIWWWLAAFCLGCQAAWGWYGFADAVFIFATAGTVGIWLAARRRQFRRLARQWVMPGLVTGLFVLAIAWPYLAHHADEPEYERSVEEVRFFGADAHDIGNPGPHRATWNDLFGSGEPAAARSMRNTGSVLHPGWIALLAMVAAGWRWRRLDGDQRRLGLLFAAIALVGVVLAFGDSVTVPGSGGRLRLPLPFGILQDVAVPFRAFRAPVRFVYLGVIAVAWLATVGVTQFTGALPRRARAWALAVVVALLWLESVPMAMLAVPAGVDGRPGRFPLPESVPAGAILTLPAPPTEQEEDATETRWLLRALATGRPVTGGVSGWVPPVTRDLRLRLAACEAGHEDPNEVLAALAAQGIVGVEMTVGASDPARVAFWEGVLTRAGFEGVDTAPDYRFFGPLAAPTAGPAPHD